MTFNLDIGSGRGTTREKKTGRAQDHGHDAQTAGRKIQRMIAAMTADVGIVRIQDTRIFPSMDHWTCLQPSDASATAVTAPIWQCVVETGCSWIVACAERRRHVDAIAAAAQVQFHSQHRITR